MNPPATSHSDHALRARATPIAARGGEAVGHSDPMDQDLQRHIVASKPCSAHLGIELPRYRNEAPWNSESHCAAILNAAMDAIVAVDHDFRITLFNRAAEELFGCNAERAIGQPFDGFVPKRLRDVLREYLRGDDAARLPAGLAALRADGEEFPIEGTVSPVRLSGKPGYTIILRDINARTKAQASLRTLQRRRESACESLWRRQEFMGVVGEAPAMQSVFRAVEVVASTDSTVLITGETGTGKELIARAVHQASKRRERPLITVNCAALPGELIESELFGHERGSFTGATNQRRGRFELADGGTIFLDEVGELPAQAQAKLLRVLQEQAFERVGGSELIKVNVRVIAATNRDLTQMVKVGKFRADLFYRLHVFPIMVPPLRERRTDIPLLVQYFVEKYAHKLGKPLHGIAPSSMERLSRYYWPGNVRELQNVIERMAIVASGPMLELDDALLLPAAEDPAKPSTGSLHDVARSHIERVLKNCGGIIEGSRGAAAVLGLKPSTLRYRMKLLGVGKPARAA